MAIALNTLVYARRLREAGFTMEQAEGQADALAAAMTESFVMKEDLAALESRIETRFVAVDLRFDEMEKRIDVRLDEQEKRIEIRLDELEKRFALRLGEMAAGLERRMTVRLLAGVGTVAALVRLL